MKVDYKIIALALFFGFVLGYAIGYYHGHKVGSDINTIQLQWNKQN